MYKIRTVRVPRTRGGGIITVDATGAAKFRTTYQIVNQHGQVVEHDLRRQEAERCLLDLEEGAAAALHHVQGWVGCNCPTCRTDR